MEKKDKLAVILTTMAASFLTPFVLSAINIAMPDIAKELSLTPNDMTWLSISFLLSSTALVIPMGKIADIYGRVRIFSAGFILFSLFSLFCALAADKNQLIFLRFLQGAASSMIWVFRIAIISSAFQKGERGKAIGFSAGAVYLGLTLGPFLGGVLTYNFTWRSIFYFSFLISLAVIFLIKRNMKTEWKGPAQKVNYKLMFFYIFSMFLLVYSGTNVVKHAFLFPAALLLFSGYVLLELKAAKPFLDLKKLVSNRIFLFSNLSAFFHYSATFSIFLLLSLYLQYSKGFSAQTSGLVLFSMPFLMMLFSPVAGRLSDKSNAGTLTTFGILLTGAGLVPFAFITPDFPVYLTIISLAAVGAGSAFFSSPNTNQVMSSLDPGSYSLGSGVLSTMRIMGQSLSMSVTNTVFYLCLPEKNLASGINNFFKSFKIIIIISLALLVVAVWASFKKTSGEEGGVL